MMLARTRWLRIVFALAGYGLLVYGGQIVSDWAMAQLQMDLRPSNQAVVHRMVMATAMLYVLLLALPFMPGIEIGVGLMIMLGPDICFLVYLSTVIALTLSFAIGRLIPTSMIVAIFEWLGLMRARNMVSELAMLPVQERLPLLLSLVPAGFLSLLLRHRYLAMAVVLNLPGNALIGGGGGLALMAGMSRLFNWSVFVLTIALAVSPFPLVYFLAGGFR
jgi:hypothetical protein